MSLIADRRYKSLHMLKSSFKLLPSVHEHSQDGKKLAYQPEDHSSICLRSLRFVSEHLLDEPVSSLDMNNV